LKTEAQPPIYYRPAKLLTDDSTGNQQVPNLDGKQPSSSQEKDGSEKEHNEKESLSDANTSHGTKENAMT
jgi:hypothetical protein